MVTNKFLLIIILFEVAKSQIFYIKRLRLPNLNLFYLDYNFCLTQKVFTYYRN